MSSLLAPLLVVHVSLALALLVPAVLLPLWLQARPGAAQPAGALGRGLVALQSRGAAPIGLGLLLSGLALLAVLGFELLTESWLLVALTIYAITLAVGLFVQRPGLRRLVGVADGPGDATWRARARRLRWVSYAMAAMVGVIGFLMSTKPDLW